MAFAVLFDNPNVSQEQYDAVRARIGIDENNPPEGGILHVAGPGPDGGWRVVEVWESEEARQKFAQETLGPVFAELGIERPEPQRWEVHAIVKR